MADYQIYNEKNIDVLKRLPDNRLDAVVTDAPYGLGKEPNALELIKAWAESGYLEIKGKGFMGKEWDAFVPQPAFWKEVYRVLKPGGYVLCFFGTRTYDWGTLAIRLAGFEIRDCIQWIYGSGFPKSLDVSKAIDSRGAQSVSWFGPWLRQWRADNNISQKEIAALFPSKSGGLTGCVANWELGLNLPTPEQFNTICRKYLLPFNSLEEAERVIVGAVSGSLLAVAPGQQNDRSKTEIQITAPATDQAKTWNGYGTALKPAHEPICVARKPLDGTVAENVLKHQCGAINLDGCRIGNESAGWSGRASKGFSGGLDSSEEGGRPKDGRFPANVIIDEEAAGVLDQQSGMLRTGGMADNIVRGNRSGYAGTMPGQTGKGHQADFGGASRFFYCAKASNSDRDYGIPPGEKNGHPTVKPINLMRYLVRLVKTPFESYTIADFFMGSGTTGVATMLEGVNFIGCDDDADSFEIAKHRIEHAKQEYLQEQAKPKQGNLFA
jgi:DNA modification methylase